MFKYDINGDPANRSFRPDLHGLLMTWLACVPTEAWQFCVGFRVSSFGGLILKFMMAPERGGPLRLIQVEVSDSGRAIHSPTHVWVEPRPVVLSMSALNQAANTI